MMEDIIEKVEAYVRKIITPPNILKHHLRTRDYLLILNPNASIEAQIAALTHDIERRLPGKVPFPMNKEGYNEEYLIKHGKRSAEHVIEFLKKNKIEVNFAKIKEIITNHELGGSEEANLVKDADSLSFFEILPKHFIEKFKDPEYCIKKFKFMFNRITSEKAKEIAKPFYDEAMGLLEK